MSAEKAVKTPRVSNPRITVSDGNLNKAAIRLLNQRLVSTELQYVKHTLGSSATQLVIDQTVVAVRSMSWTSIVLPE
jgi:hypothetical protein